MWDLQTLKEGVYGKSDSIQEVLASLRTFSIAFHIPYRVRPSSTTTSSSDSETAARPQTFARARYRSTSTRSTRPFFPLPGASNVSPLRSAARSGVLRGGPARPLRCLSAGKKSLNSGAGESLGSSGCARRAIRASSETIGGFDASRL
jgi:hypothetical protein